MKKINQGYLSLYEFLCGDYNTDGYVRYNPNPYSGQQIIGAFQPLVNMYDDLLQTFKPYKSDEDRSHDVAVLRRGLGNVIKGAFVFTSSLLILIVMLPATLIIASSRKDTLSYLKYPISWVINGACTIIRGLTQVAATPLVWLRSLIRSCIPAKPVKFEEKKSIKHLVAVATNPGTNDNQRQNIVKELRRRYVRDVDKLGVQTDIKKLPPFDRHDKRFPQDVAKHLELFARPNRSQAEEGIKTHLRDKPTAPL